jgi:nitrogen fixation protein FixH
MKHPRPLTGRTVLVCLIGFFGVVALANAILVRAAVSTFGGVETSSSYQAGLAFARDAAAARAQDGLHWQVKANVRPISESVVIEIDAHDGSGRPLGGLEANVILHHPTDGRADQPVSVSEDTAGHFRGTAIRFAGQRELMIELSRGGERLFRSRNRVVLQ